MPIIDSAPLKPHYDKAIHAREQYADAVANAQARSATQDRDPEGYGRALDAVKKTMDRTRDMDRELADAVIKEIALLERQARAEGE